MRYSWRGKVVMLVKEAGEQLWERGRLRGVGDAVVRERRRAVREVRRRVILDRLGVGVTGRWSW